MINRKDSCIGITLFKFGRYKLELWFAPSDYECLPHIHKDSSGEFFVLYGKNREIWKEIVEFHNTVKHTGSFITDFMNNSHWVRKSYNLSGRKYFKWLSVRHDITHGFSKGTTPMIWLCFETYKEDSKVTSPAIDFHLVNSNT